jgi:hypothetical protein
MIYSGSSKDTDNLFLGHAFVDAIEVGFANRIESK